MNKGLFNLDGFEFMAESDVLYLNIDESPSFKLADATSIKTASKSTIRSDDYNDAIALLQKSFKECYEVLEMLKKDNAP